MSGELAALAGKYSLSHVNGAAQDLSQPAGLELTVMPDDASRLRVHARVANNINGSAKLENGKLKGLLMSTRMRAGPAESVVEGLLGNGFMDGMAYTLEGGVLTMTTEKGSLTWKAY